MSEQMLNILKLALLAVIYLFLLRVVRAVWAEIGPPRTAPPRRQRGAATTAAAPARLRRGRGNPAELVAIEPPDQAGRRYPLGDEITVGRAAGCQVTIDDTYVSQLH